MPGLAGRTESFDDGAGPHGTGLDESHEDLVRADALEVGCIAARLLQPFHQAVGLRLRSISSRSNAVVLGAA